MVKVRTHWRLLVAFALVMSIAGCGGGGGDTETGGESAPPAAVPVVGPSNVNLVIVAPAPDPVVVVPAGNVTVSGTVTFDLVPAVAGLGLDYPHTRVSPARGVGVELVGGTTLLASTMTDAAGSYSFSVAPNTNVAVRVRAEMLRTGSPTWNFRVVDNTSGDALYVLNGTAASVGSSDSTRNLHAGSGWGGSSYTGTRAAAPFAILDAVYDSAQLVLTANPVAVFPALQLHWSPSNVPEFASDGAPDPDSGKIGTSYFSATGSGRFQIFLVGAENVDTDEYDRHVIVHEWGHYFERAFSRSDSIGGPHTRGDQLDMRVAFGEGWGNALSAMVTGQSVYRDVSGNRQSSGFAFDVEGSVPSDSDQNPGWYSEESIQEILYDLFDNSTLDAAQDAVSLGFAPLYSVLANQQRTSVALTSVFPFITALKATRPAEAPAIDGLVAAHGIASVSDDYGTGETNSGHPANADLQSIYRTITVNGGKVNVCSIDAFSSPYTDSLNKLGSRRFLKFTASVAGTHTATATATLVPANASADPDMILHRAGPLVAFDDEPAANCTNVTPLNCRETGTGPLAAGDYVLEVYEWTNTNAREDEWSPPIGRTCFDVEVTRP